MVTALPPGVHRARNGIRGCVYLNRKDLKKTLHAGCGPHTPAGVARIVKRIEYLRARYGIRQRKTGEKA